MSSPVTQWTICVHVHRDISVILSVRGSQLEAKEATSDTSLFLAGIWRLLPRAWNLQAADTANKHIGHRSLGLVLGIYRETMLKGHVRKALMVCLSRALV